jgi:AhpD family alkylhydroperoxidase
MNNESDRRAILRQVKDNIGFVPEFLKVVPDPHLAPLWSSIRDLELTPGKIPAMYQQLIMLAVSTHARCVYCTELHKQMAKALGVTDEELVETALLTGHTANVGNVLGSIQYDLELFRREARNVAQALAGNIGAARLSRPSSTLLRSPGV